MEFPELSLSLAATQNDDEEIRLPMKRKIHNCGGGGGSVDLHQPWKEPLPLDWEQCLDLQSGRMYYVNRKTMKKTWEWPKEEQKQHSHHHHHLNLELNISTTGHYKKHHHHPSSSSQRQQPPTNGGGGGEEMIALPCSNCHLLVIVSQSSPSCPNCKFLQYSTGNPSPAKPTFHSGLSLFN